ncbi:MAG: hypothetical protein L0211_02485 [Planctomycetaceae bacterium]|nr:hypothetical protein [Planctomycetaceae bacterium]
MRYRLRTLLILLAVGPVVLAGAWFAGSELLRPRLTKVYAGDHRYGKAWSESMAETQAMKDRTDKPVSPLP